jgi:two-component system cell cycle response regulator CpdR
MPGTVLLVEDDDLVRTVLAEYFQEISLTVIAATSADQAWADIEAGLKFDILFTDLQLPGAISGRDLVKRVSTKFPNAGIIVASGKPGPCLGIEFDHFLHKPFDAAAAAAGLVVLVLRMSDR